MNKLNLRRKTTSAVVLADLSDGEIAVERSTGNLVINNNGVLAKYNDQQIPLSAKGALIASATEKTTPVNADFVGVSDSEASNILKKLSWTNIKATLKAYFDTIYQNAPTYYANADNDGAINFALGDIIHVKMTGSFTLTYANAIPNKKYILLIEQPTATAFSVTIPTGSWREATPLNSNAGGIGSIHSIYIQYIDGKYHTRFMNLSGTATQWSKLI